MKIYKQREARKITMISASRLGIRARKTIKVKITVDYNIREMQ